MSNEKANLFRENGNLSINTENLLPIIKKWLYSETDIFVRELVSNASDAISKMKKLVSVGEANLPEDERYDIKVVINRDDKTIKIIDNGVGMTDEEVRRYINQIAFSGAVEFLEKYSDSTDEQDQIIGHFGLGFYSAFMIAEKVEIDTLSYQDGASAVSWKSDGGVEYIMGPSGRTERGTTITLFVEEEGFEFLEYHKMLETLNKYFAFLPTEIYLIDETKEADEATGGEAEEKTEPLLKPINDTHPLWLKPIKDCTDDEYKSFYQKAFNDFNDPLFWIHLNMDYPFRLKGILYFPQFRHEFDPGEGQVKLFYNQVFVADNVKEIIPEFLLLLKGVIDCPDLPLNVSRSFLQNDGHVNKIATHITKKVADKLISLYEKDRDNYNKYWEDINPFVKFGCMKESKFYDRVKDIVIFKTINGEFTTLKDYLEKNKEKHKEKVFYITDEKQQAQYIKLFKDNGLEALIMDAIIDNHFMQFLEMKGEGYYFSRVDADLSDSIIAADAPKMEEEDAKKLKELFKEALGNDKLNVEVEPLKSESTPGMVLLSEHSRRIMEMSMLYGRDLGPSFAEGQKLVLNSGNKLIQTLLKLKDQKDRQDDVKLICHHIYDLAMLSHKQLEAEAMTDFIQRSSKLLERLAEIEKAG
jgi:molecular chaperone HtpG